MRCYEITLPLPTSINAAHTVGGGYKCKVTGKWRRQVVRSDDYNTWVQYAGIEWRKQFPYGVAEIFTGRIRVDYIFLWIDGARGTESSDIGNREKVLSDFLQKKFFENDRLIDEQHQYRRLTRHGENRVIVRVTEIPDHRFDDPRDVLQPLQKEENK